MKQLYDELKLVHNWCFCCPHTDLMRELNSMDSKGKKGSFMKSREYKVSMVKLLESMIKIKYNNDIEEIEETEEELQLKEWSDWEKEYEQRAERNNVELCCPYLRKKNLSINIDRNFIIPSDEKEILRLLDSISSCYLQECIYNRAKHLYSGSLDTILRKALAKIDFALIEQGKDYGKLMRDMYFPYYERKVDIHECGYSWDLIRYYMKKYDIPLLSNDEYDMKDSFVQKIDYNNTIEYNDAYNDGKCDINGVLLVTKAEYTRYATDKYNIKSSYKHEWTRFDNIFTDNKGKTISYKSFMQSYRDQDLSSM